MAYKYFDKKSSGGATKDKIFSKQRPLDLATQKLLENFKNAHACSSSKRDIWGANLADIQLISRYNEGFRILLCVIDAIIKYPWVIPLKDRKKYYNY